MAALHTKLAKYIQATNNNKTQKNKTVYTLQTKLKTLLTPYQLKRHPTMQASQTKIKEILPGII